MNKFTLKYRLNFPGSVPGHYYDWQKARQVLRVCSSQVPLPCWTGAPRTSMVPSAHPRVLADLGVLQLTAWVRVPNFFPSAGEAVHWHQMLWCPKINLQCFQSIGSVWKTSCIMGVGLLLIHTLSFNTEKLSGQFEPSHFAGKRSLLSTRAF